MLRQGLLALGDYMNVQCHACIGGTNVGEDIRKLDYGQHVVAGTPGRVFGKPGPRSVPRVAGLRGVTCRKRREGSGMAGSFLGTCGLTAPAPGLQI